MNDSDGKFALTHKLILYTAPIVAIVGVVIPLIFGQFSLSLLGSYLAIPMIFAPFIYLKLCLKPYIPRNSKKSLLLALLILYFVGSSISIFLIFFFEIRPIAYYIIITIMATCILLEILLNDRLSRTNVIIILLQIMFLSLNIIYGVSLKYFYFIARTDPLAHAWFIDSIIKYGHVTSILETYKPFPLWHILVSSLYDIFSLPVPVHKIMFLTGGLVFSFLIVIVYLITLKLFRSDNLGLLSSLFVCFYSDVVYFGTSSIARSIVMFLELVLILLLLDINSIKKIILSIFLTLTIILYHPASIPFILLILLVIYAFQKFYGVDGERKFLTISYLLTSFIMTLMYWMFYAEEIFQNLIETAIERPPPGILSASIVYFPLNELFNYLQYGFLFFFVLLGVLMVLQPKGVSGLSKIFCLSGLFLALISFPGPALLMNKLASGIQITRLVEYSFLFICIAGAVGLFLVYHNSGKQSQIILVLLVIVMCFLSISNDFSASDNPLVKRIFYTYYLTEEEITAFNHVAKMGKGYLMSDYVTNRYFRFSPYRYVARVLDVDKENMNFLIYNDNDIILIRKQELSKRPLKLYTSEPDTSEPEKAMRSSIKRIFKEEYCYNDLYIWKTLEKFNEIYDSKGVVAYISH